MWQLCRAFPIRQVKQKKKNSYSRTMDELFALVLLMLILMKLFSLETGPEL